MNDDDSESGDIDNLIFDMDDDEPPYLRHFDEASLRSSTPCKNMCICHVVYPGFAQNICCQEETYFRKIKKIIFRSKFFRYIPPNFILIVRDTPQTELILNDDILSDIIIKFTPHPCPINIYICPPRVMNVIGLSPVPLYNIMSREDRIRRKKCMGQRYSLRVQCHTKLYVEHQQKK